MSLRTTACLGILLFLTACASSSPRTKAGPSDVERDAYALLIAGPKENPVKKCSVLALKLNSGLTMMKMGNASDERVAEALKSGIPASNKGLLSLREQQIAVWRESHDPGRLALLDFEYCQLASGVVSSLGTLGKTCFSLANVPATAEAFKAAGRSAERATGDLIAAFGSQFPEGYLKRITEDVYARDAAAGQYEAHRRVLASCIRDTR